MLHLDGIAARALPRKLSGVFPAMRVEDDPLFFSQTLTMPVPQDRDHDIPEDQLGSYRVLSRLAHPQLDIFTREPAGRSRFVFLQGHPEYDGATLGREYLRDLERFHGGELPAPPAVPDNYFDRATESRLEEAGADLARAGEIVSEALPLQSWRLHTGRLFANWLTLVASAKSRRVTSRGVHTRKRA